DAISQLIGVTLPDSSATSYNLDAAGNRTSVTDTESNTGYITNDLNQYTDVGGDTYTYDANGNMTSKTTSTGTTTYSYDFENRLIQVTTPDETVSYTYDPMGRRTSKTTTSGTTRFIHDGFQVILEKDETDTVQAAYTYGIGIDEVLVMEHGGNKYFYSQDGLGSVVGLTDDLESVLESYSYDAYGIPNSTSILGNPYQFTGRKYEKNTELYFYRARYFDPEMGRFLNADPTGFWGGLNFYSYVNNNPINIVDPTGHYGILFQLGRISPVVIAIGDLIGQIATVLKEPEFQPRRPPCSSLCWDRNGNLYGPDTLPSQRPPCASLCWDRNGNLYGPETQRPTPAGSGGDTGKDENCSDNNTCAPDPTFIQRTLNSNKRGNPTADLIKKPSQSAKGLTAKIEVPYPQAMVRGDVPVFGLAHGKNFKRYRVEFGAGKNPSNWTTLAASDTPQTKKVTDKDLDDSLDITIHGNLATWDTGLKNYVYLPSHPADHPVKHLYDSSGGGRKGWQQHRGSRHSERCQCHPQCLGWQGHKSGWSI
ncbi:MAG: hypothetical protein GXP18_09770, partial [Gammaproteobacteria bacterium]|nr:hypothetical protein [Gammaproteobacteria bacterium]